MRIIAGRWRGTALTPPPGRGTRPVLDHVKESVFNILGTRMASPGTLPPCCVLDLFAGTGSFGLEALSRGARFCTFVEHHPATARQLRRNLERLRARELAEVQTRDIWKMDLTVRSAPADHELVFVDPPYKDAEVLNARAPLARLLRRLANAACVSPSAMVVLRHPRKMNASEDCWDEFDLLDQRRYGDMTVTFLQCRPPGFAADPRQ